MNQTAKMASLKCMLTVDEPVVLIGIRNLVQMDFWHMKNASIRPLLASQLRNAVLLVVKIIECIKE